MMARPGPAPTPTAILKMRGTARADRRRGEPQPHRGRPRCPAWLDRRAKDLWKRLVPQLQQMGVLARIDGQALARYCQTYSQYIDMVRAVRKDGYKRGIKNGYEQQTPEVGIATKLQAILLKLEAEFGMTPSARARLSVQEEPPKDDIGDILLGDGTDG